MSDTLFHSSVNNVVPYQAQYSFPSQATKYVKSTIRVPSSRGGTFTSTTNNQISWTIPSDQMINMLNSVIQFDVDILWNVAGVRTGTSQHSPIAITAASVGAGATQQITTTILAATGGIVDTQYQVENTLVGWFLVPTTNNLGPNFELESLKPLRITASSYSSSVHTLTYTGPLTNAQQGISATTTFMLCPPVMLRRNGIHSLVRRLRVTYGGVEIEMIDDYDILSRVLYEVGVSDNYVKSVGTVLDGSHDGSWNNVWTGKKTYAFNPFLGLTSLKKLLPAKWSAAALKIDFDLVEDARALVHRYHTGRVTDKPYFVITDPYMYTEFLDFDSTYDAGFYMGLATTGVPLHMKTFRTHSFPISGAIQTFVLPEKARSIKYLLAVITDTAKDSAADTYFYSNIQETHTITTGNQGSTSNVADRIATGAGGAGDLDTYQIRVGGRYQPAQPVRCSLGGSEAFEELLKVLDANGDYTFNSNINATNWVTANAGGKGSGGKFIIAMEFEQSDVLGSEVISGMNGEEVSDLALTLKFNTSGSYTSGKQLHVFICFDELLIVRDKNMIDLVM